MPYRSCRIYKGVLVTGYLCRFLTTECNPYLAGLFAQGLFPTDEDTILLLVGFFRLFDWIEGWGWNMVRMVRYFATLKNFKKRKKKLFSIKKTRKFLLF